MAGIDRLRTAKDHKAEAGRQATGNTTGTNAAPRRSGRGLDRLRGGPAATGPTEQETTNLEMAADSRVRSVTDSVGRVFEGRAQAVSDWKRTAEYAVSLAESDDPDAQEALNYLMWEHGDKLRPHTDVLVGEDFWDKNLQEKPGPSVGDRILGGLGAVGEKLDSGVQPVLHAIGGVTAGLADDEARQGLSRADAFKEAGRYGARAIDVTRLLPNYGGITEDALFPDETEGGGRIMNEAQTGGITLDQDGDGRLSLKEALNRTTEGNDNETVPYLQDFVVEVANIVGEIALDPTTALSAGTPALARTGSRAVIAQASKEGIELQAREMLERAATVGLRNLDESEQAVINGLLNRAVEDAGQQAVRRGVARRPLAEAQLRAMENGMQSGIRMGGTTVLPSHTITRNLLRRATGRGWRGQQLYEVVGERTVEQFRQLDEALADQAAEPLLREAADDAMRQVNDLMESGQTVTADIAQRAKDTQAALDNATAKATEVGDILDDVVYRGYQQGWAAEILGLPGIRHALGALKPAARTSVLLGSEAAADLRAVLRRARVGEEAMDAMTQRLYAMKTDGKIDAAIMAVEKDGAAPDVIWDQLRRYGRGQSVTGMNPKVQELADELENIRAAFKANLVMAGATDEVLASVKPQVTDMLLKTVRYGKVDDLRGVQQEVAARALTETVGPGRELDGELGRLAIEAKPNQAMPEGYVSKTINGKEFFFDESVAADIDDLSSIFAKPRGAEGVLKGYDIMNTVWGLGATSLLPNPAFINRNIFGNMFNLGGAGFSSPENLVRGFTMARRYTAAETLMHGNPGMQLVDALTQVGASPAQIQTITDMAGQGLLGTGRVTDVLAEEAGRRSLDDTVSKIRANRVAGMGIRANEIAEQQARMALYLDQIGKGATPRDAADVVTRFLFDYGDLTTAERKIRRAVRFYTFIRKNTALQASMLAENPARIARIQKAVDSAEAALLDEDGELEVPDWMPTGVAGTMRGLAMAINFETTADAAIDASSLVTTFVEALAEHGDPKAELEDSIAGRPHGAAAVADAFTNLLSGFGPAVWDFIQETETGRDSFTGRPLRPDENTRDGAFFRLAETFMPAVSRGERMYRTSPLTGDSGALEPEMFLLRNLLGVEAREINDADEQEERDAGDIERAIDQYIIDVERRGGEKLPTLDKLREDGTYRARNRLMEAMAYGWEADEDGELRWDERIYDNTLLSMVPKRLRQHWGLPDPDGDVRTIGRGSGPARVEEGEEGYEEQVARDSADVRGALQEWLGRDLDDEEALVAALLMPGSVTMAEAEDMGIEPIRTSNRFLPDDEQVQLGLSGAETLQMFADAWGLAPETASSLRPRQAEMERILGEADAAGLTTAELIEQLTRASDEGGMGYFSRSEAAYLNQVYGAAPGGGIIDLSTTRLPTWTEEDALKAQEKAWEREMDLRLFARLRGLPDPSTAQIEAYVLNAQMSGKELDILGEENLDNAKARKDIRSDEMKLADALQERAATRSGLSAFTDRYRR